MKGVRSCLRIPVSVNILWRHGIHILQCHALVCLEPCLIGRITGPDTLLSSQAIDVDLQASPGQILPIQTSGNCEIYDTGIATQHHGEERLEICEPDNVTVIESAFVPARDGDVLAELRGPNLAIYISKDCS